MHVEHFTLLDVTQFAIGARLYVGGRARRLYKEVAHARRPHVLNETSPPADTPAHPRKTPLAQPALYCYRSGLRLFISLLLMFLLLKCLRVFYTQVLHYLVSDPTFGNTCRKLMSAVKIFAAYNGSAGRHLPSGRV